MRAAAPLFALLLVAQAPQARAADLRLDSATYLRGHVRPGAPQLTTHLPLYQLISLRAADLGLAGLSLEADLWGTVEALDVIDTRASGDVSVLLLRYQAPARSKLRGLRVSVGRQLVALGSSILEQLDGGAVDYRLPLGIELAAFGGLVTGARFSRQAWYVGQDSDRFGLSWVVGGRLGFRFGDRVAAGVSYRHKRHGGRLAFSELGWDAVVTPLGWLELLCAGALELTAGGIREAQLGLRVIPTLALELGAGYRLVRPDLGIPRTSIFAVFAQQAHQQAYAEAFWAPARWLDLSTEATVRIHGQSCLRGQLSGAASCDAAALSWGAVGRATLRLGPDRRHRLVLEGERVGAPEGGFTRARAAATAPLFWRLRASASVDLYLLDDAPAQAAVKPDATSWGVAGGALVGLALREDLQLSASGRVMTSPLMAHAGSVMLRLRWRLDLARTRGAARGMP